MRFVPAIIIAIAIILAPLVFLGVREMMRPEVGFIDGPAVDSGARIEIERLREQIETQRERIEALEKRVDLLEAAPPAPPVPSNGPLPNQGPNTIIDEYASVVIIADRLNVNRGLTVATPSYLEGVLGRPREVLSDSCEAMTNPDLKSLLVLEDVGPVRVRMLRPAAASLARVFERVRETDQDLYDRINTSGSLCVRRIRGTQARLSSHAFGLSIDLNIDGQLDNFTDGKTQLGLTILADFFHEEGWIWGAGFRREDSMHFEISRELLETWRSDGLI